MRRCLVARIHTLVRICGAAMMLVTGSLFVSNPVSAQNPVDAEPQPTTIPAPSDSVVEQDPSASEPTGPTVPEASTTAPESTTIDATTAPEATTTSTTPSSTTTSSTTETSTTADDGSGEESRGGYSSQPTFVPDSVDPAKVAQAQAKLASAKHALADAEHLEKAREENLVGVNARVDQLGQESANLVNNTAELQEGIRKMALATFKNPSLLSPELSVESSHQAMTGHKFVAFVAAQDQAAIEEFSKLQAELSIEEAEKVEETAVATGEHNQAKLLVEQRAKDLEQAELELQTYEAAAEVYIPNAVFPVARPFAMPLINSYGFDRARGTANSHWHEGIDIFGPRGTDLLAAESGVVTDVGSGRLGGLKLWITGVSGTKWYYAHLDGFAPGLTEGQHVNVGDVVGYLGDSGNAKGTPPHLHLEMHPPGKHVVNPYPQLNVLAHHERKNQQIDGADSGEVDQDNVSAGL